MPNAMPAGDIIRPMERGQVTIPAKIRNKLNITPKTSLNIFEWRGMVVIAPVELKFKTVSRKRKAVDWVRDNSKTYMAKVRYNPLEELWAEMARKNW